MFSFLVNLTSCVFNKPSGPNCSCLPASPSALIGPLHPPSGDFLPRVGSMCSSLLLPFPSHFEVGPSLLTLTSRAKADFRLIQASKRASELFKVRTFKKLTGVWRAGET